MALMVRTARASLIGLPAGSCVVDPSHKSGAFNVVWFITFSDGQKWVARLPMAEWSPALERRMKLEIHSMGLIRERTSLPIPIVYDYSYNGENQLGRPYVFMSCVDGVRLSDLRYKANWMTQDKRMKVFRSIITNISQLGSLEFDSIGCVDFDPETKKCSVVPLHPTMNQISEGRDLQEMRGPYRTAHASIQGRIEHEIRKLARNDNRRVSMAELIMLRMFAGMLSDIELDGPPFHLAMPDFNFQNIFIDDDGNVTGFIDWDDVEVVPRTFGFARYPAWITVDWDPLLYPYPGLRRTGDKDDSKSQDTESDDSEIQDTKADDSKTQDTKTADSKAQETESEDPLVRRQTLRMDSPQELEQYKQEYLDLYTEIDPSNAHITRYSHIHEALEIAISSSMCRSHILDKLTKYVFGKNDEYHLATSGCDLEEMLKKGSWLEEEKRRMMRT